MKIEYIYHSGFTIETDNYFLVFDYYKGDLDLTNKKTIIFSTHGHQDHFNKKILNWLNDYPHTLYVLSSDIISSPSNNIYILDPYEELKLHDVEIKSFGSTDLGLSLLIKVEGKNIFFAGDLNWWYWDEDSEDEKKKMEYAFKGEIEKLIGYDIDIAFFPVDPRLEENYYLGGEYFIKKLTPKNLFPMHFGDNYEITTKFVHKLEDTSTNIVEINKRNQVFEIN